MKHDISEQFFVCRSCGCTLMELYENDRKMECKGVPTSAKEIINLVKLKQAGEKVKNVVEV